MPRIENDVKLDFKDVLIRLVTFGLLTLKYEKPIDFDTL
jgi:hypothetical protein